MALAVIAPTLFAADITGKVTLKGTPPPEKEIAPLMNDPICGKLHTAPVKTRFYVVDASGNLADVVVSLKGVSGKSTGASATPAVVDQKGCEYAPYVFAVQTGQKINVKNSDPVLHNVHPTPAVAGNKEENKAQMPNGPDLTFAFEKPEPFLKFACNVHPWMFAYASVFDHPYFAVTGKDGTFKIANVPPGKYTIEAQHRKGGVVTQEITVEGDKKVDFTIELKGQ
ncbi:MAG: hypothetical protein HY298_12130 [Verrucomicrobia bacterium]|nr:hypothetical protein [Verrucomicrobiota bacterium]